MKKGQSSMTALVFSGFLSELDEGFSNPPSLPVEILLCGTAPELWHWCGILRCKISSHNSDGFTSNFLSISFIKKLAPRELLLVSVYLYWGDTIHKSMAWQFQFLCFLQLPKRIRQDWLQDWLHLCISRQEGTTEDNSFPDLLSDTSRETWYTDICS